MSKLTIRLWGVLNRESHDSINYQIAETILHNIFTLRGTSTSSLADLCHVSRPSISRFCKDLGYSDFYEFRMELSQYSIENKHNDAYNMKKNLGTMGLFISQCKKYADMLEKNVDEVAVNQLVNDIAVYPTVYIMGHMQSGCTALNMQYNLFAAKKTVTAVTDLILQKDVFNHLSGDELIIVISSKGKFFENYFEEGRIPELPKTSILYFMTANPDIRELKGANVINCGTGQDIAASNLSLELLADIIALKYNMQFCF